jgi:protein ImuB
MTAPLLPSRRFLALHLPELATDRIHRAEPGLPRDRPLATWAQSGSRRLLAAVNSPAAAAGLRPGQALADAQAILPDLLLCPAMPEADAEALEALALWARRYTPLAATDPSDGLLLDITGCAHLMGGETALMQDALDRLARAGVAAQGAVAGAAATASALARARSDNPVAAPGIEAAVAAPLPLGPALRLPEEVLAGLARLGLRRVDDLLRQPRAPLARRFGTELLARLDAVTGRRAEPFRSAQPPPDLRVARDLMEPIITRAGIEAVLDRLLAALCTKLREAGHGARRVTLSAWRVDGVVQEVAIGTGLPAREPAHLRRLLAEKLGWLEPGLGFERMALEAWASDPMPEGQQGGFGDTGGPARDEAMLAEELAKLLDRLGQRGLRVQRAAPVASHWPERMVRALEPHAAVPPMPPGWRSRPSPVLLLRRPVKLEAVEAPLPDDPPLLLRWAGAVHRLHRASGPLRLEPEWWHAGPQPARRDYHQVELPSGLRLWIFHGGEDRWLLHGHLP